MFDDFFYYTKSQRRAILVLSVLLCVVLSGWIISSVWRDVGVPEKMTVADSLRVDSFLASIRREQKSSSAMFVVKQKDQSEPLQARKLFLHPFNPNTVDSVELIDMGIPTFIAQNMMRYREKGGRFKNAAALSRIYGMDSSLFNQLKSFVQITDKIDSKYALVKEDTLEAKTLYAKTEKFTEGTLVDLNSADTIILKKVPGIGSFLARKIVAYRNRLGGFVAVDQLQDIRQIEVSLNKWFSVSGKPLRYLEINNWGLDALRSHPYMDFYKAKAIIEYRRKRGNIKSLSQLSLFEEFSEKDLKRLSPYLKF